MGSVGVVCQWCGYECDVSPRGVFVGCTRMIRDREVVCSGCWCDASRGRYKKR